MAWDVQGPLTYLTTLIDGLTSMSGTVYQGEPETPDSRVAGMASVGGFDLQHETTSTMVRWQRYWVEFYYRVGGNESVAEGVIADLVDEFCQAWQNDLTLGGMAQDTKLDGNYADQPDYRLMRGPEFRVYPLLVSAKQRNLRT
jgi:hypothetical protein